MGRLSGSGRPRPGWVVPGFRRHLLVRRLAAVGLASVALAGLLPRAGETVEAVVLAHPVPAGHRLSAGDVTLRATAAADLPAGALTGAEGLGEAVDEVTVSTLGAGEVLTDVKVVGQAAVRALGAGEELNMVPLTPADPQVVALLRHGDEVSVLTAEADTDAARVIARDARVVLPGDGGDDAGAQTLLLALPPEPAQAVAAAALESPLAVVLTGQRAGGAETGGAETGVTGAVN